MEANKQQEELIGSYFADDAFYDAFVALTVRLSDKLQRQSLGGHKPLLEKISAHLEADGGFIALKELTHLITSLRERAKTRDD